MLLDDPTSALFDGEAKKLATCFCVWLESSDRVDKTLKLGLVPACGKHLCKCC